MKRSPSLLLLAAALAGSLASCGGGGDSDPFATSSQMKLDQVMNGFGRLLPYVVAVPDPITGLPSSQLVEIRSLQDLLDNPPSETNPILPPASWPTQAINPAGRTANHFVAVRFTRSLDVDSVLDPSPSGLANNGLTGAITVVAYDPATGVSEIVPGRGFVDAYTYVGVTGKLER